MWKKIKLSEIADIIGGGTPSTLEPSYWGGPIAWLTPKDLSGYQYRYISEGERNITKKGLKNSSAQLMPKNTVLFTSRAPIGYVAITKNNITTNQGFKSLVLKSDQSPEFYYYLLKHNKTYIESMGTGSTFKEISGSSLKNLEFLVPDTLDEQKRIADILSNFDNKIELLQKQNKTLEDMAKAIFKSWFVDFDIVKAKEKKEKKSKILNEYKITEEIYNLFPDSFEDSELGEIPKGWEAKPTKELLTFNIGGGWGNDDNKKDFTIPAFVIRGTDIPKIKLFGNISDVPYRYHKESNFNSRKLINGDIILETAGGSKGQPVGRALLITPYIIQSLQNAICASFCKLLRVNNIIYSSNIFYYFLEFMYETLEIEQYQVQSTGISNFQFEYFLTNKFFVVPKNIKIINLFDSIINNLNNKMDNNKYQIQTLTEIRDTLLPKLISGKIEVK